MKSVVWKMGLIAALVIRVFVPAPAHAQGGGGSNAPASVIPETQIELEIIDTSGNDPLLGGESPPIENARVKAILRQKGKSVLSQTAVPAGRPGVFGVYPLLKTNGAYTLTWEVTPQKSEPFKVEFPIQVAGAPDKSAPFFSGWRIPAAVAGGMILLFGVFTLGRLNGRNGSSRAVVALLLCACLTASSTGAWAHPGHDQAASKAGPAAIPVADLKVGIGDLKTTTQTKTAGKYKTTLTVRVIKPAAPDPNHVRLTPEQVKTIGLQTVAAKGGTFATGLAVTGQVQPNPASTVTLASRVPGRIRSVSATVGERVRAGQTLAVIESADIAEAQGAYSAAQGEVLAKVAAYRQTQARVQIAVRQLAQQKELARAGAFSQAPLQQAQTEQAQAASDVATVRADVAAAQSELAQARADQATHAKSLQRIQELFDAGIRSRAELEAQQLEVEQDTARVAQAEALVTQQQKRVAQAEARGRIMARAVAREQKLFGTNVLTRKEIVQAQGVVDTARLEARGAQADLGSARRAVQAARARLDALGAAPGSGNAISVTAPLDAIVTEREAAAGETVSPDKTLFTLLNPSVVIVEGDVFEKSLPDVRAGLPVQVTTEAAPGRRFTGRISSIGATVDPQTRAVRVRVVIANPGGVLRPGMFVRALLVNKTRSQTVSVPDAAVQEDGGLKVVYVKQGDTFERREVSVGESAGGRTEIKSGIKPGEQVVTTGAYQLQSVGKA